MVSMTFLASFLKTETLVMENYCPFADFKLKVNGNATGGDGGRAKEQNIEIFIKNKI